MLHIEMKAVRYTLFPESQNSLNLMYQGTKLTLFRHMLCQSLEKEKKSANFLHFKISRKGHSLISTIRKNMLDIKHWFIL
jgi:hypothetical protein